MIFDEGTVKNYDEWLKTPQGHYIDNREKALILDLIAPRRGEKLLDVCCGTGERLLLFKDRGCDVTGIEPSVNMLAIARQKLGSNVELYSGRPEELPFSDNEFDIVSLITSFEFTDDPAKAIGEAIRVSRGRVFIGVLNSCSCTAIQRRFGGLFRPSLCRKARFSHIYGLTGMVRQFLPDARIQWGSVIFLPSGWYRFAAGLEETIPVMNNPFGAFLGVSFPVTFTLMTVQDIIGDPFKIKAKSGQPLRGTVREITK